MAYRSGKKRMPNWMRKTAAMLADHDDSRFYPQERRWMIERVLNLNQRTVGSASYDVASRYRKYIDLNAPESGKSAPAGKEPAYASGRRVKMNRKILLASSTSSICCKQCCGANRSTRGR
ncbi:hypothetical protein KCP75_10830 [Salmonella enterica subsp. enterica]|nr:hypothetical protein KCP75_10830 [Salmonella enterica subsp. enterica]